MERRSHSHEKRPATFVGGANRREVLGNWARAHPYTEMAAEMFRPPARSVQNLTPICGESPPSAPLPNVTGLS